MSTGILYVASGSSYLEEARTSAQSVKRHNPSLPITLYTDGDPDSDVFDRVVSLDEPIENWGESILSGDHFPYDQNIYMDTDTYVCGDITDLFQTLDRFDLAASHDVSRGMYNSEFYDDLDRDVPGSFPEYNTGVMAYNDCAAVREVFEDWGRKYDSHEYNRNQPAFRFALYDSDVSFTTLPPEYNFRVDRVGYACGPVKILHSCSLDATAADFSKFADAVNADDGKRVITWDDYPCRVVPEGEVSRRHTVKHLTNEVAEKRRQDGTIPLTRSAVKVASSKLFPSSG